jgi:hypothetical protein
MSGIRQFSYKPKIREEKDETTDQQGGCFFRLFK